MLELLKRYAELAPEEITVGRRGTTMCLVSSPLISPYVLELAIDENSSHNAHPYFDFIVQGMVQRAVVSRGYDFSVATNLEAVDRFAFGIEGGNGVDWFDSNRPGLASLKAYIKLLEGLGND